MMSDIQRYEILVNHSESADFKSVIEVEPSSVGEWVTYDDYVAAFDAEHQRLQDKLHRERVRRVDAEEYSRKMREALEGAITECERLAGPHMLRSTAAELQRARKVLAETKMGKDNRIETAVD